MVREKTWIQSSLFFFYSLDYDRLRLYEKCNKRFCMKDKEVEGWLKF